MGGKRLAPEKLAAVTRRSDGHYSRTLEHPGRGIAASIRRHSLTIEGGHNAGPLSAHRTFHLVPEALQTSYAAAHRSQSRWLAAVTPLPETGRPPDRESRQSIAQPLPPVAIREKFAASSTSRGSFSKERTGVLQWIRARTGSMTCCPMVVEDGVGTFILMSDDPEVMERFITEVAPALREAAELALPDALSGARVRSSVARSKRRPRHRLRSCPLVVGRCRRGRNPGTPATRACDRPTCAAVRPDSSLAPGTTAGRSQSKRSLLLVLILSCRSQFAAPATASAGVPPTMAVLSSVSPT